MTRWPWKFVVHQASCEQNLYEIERNRNRAILIWFTDDFRDFLHTFCHAMILTFDLLTLNFYGTSIVLCLNSVQKLSEID